VLMCGVTGEIKPQVAVGEECCITLNKADAGPGCVTCHVINTTTSSEIVTRVIDNHDGTVSIKYVPTVQGTYSVDIKYGGVTIPTGRITQQVHSTTPSLRLSVCLSVCLSVFLSVCDAVLYLKYSLIETYK